MGASVLSAPLVWGAPAAVKNNGAVRAYTRGVRSDLDRGGAAQRVPIPMDKFMMNARPASPQSTRSQLCPISLLLAPLNVCRSGEDGTASRSVAGGHCHRAPERTCESTAQSQPGRQQVPSQAEYIMHPVRARRAHPNRHSMHVTPCHATAQVVPCECVPIRRAGPFCRARC